MISPELKIYKLIEKAFECIDSEFNTLAADQQTLEKYKATNPDKVLFINARQTALNTRAANIETLEEILENIPKLVQAEKSRMYTKGRLDSKSEITFTTSHYFTNNKDKEIIRFNSITEAKQKYNF